MDEIMILLFIGFIFVGFLIGYPFGHIFGKREATWRAERREQQPEETDILLAEVIE